MKIGCVEVKYERQNDTDVDIMRCIACMVTLDYAKITLYMKLCQLYVCICLDLQHLAGHNHM